MPVFVLKKAKGLADTNESGQLTPEIGELLLYPILYPMLVSEGSGQVKVRGTFLNLIEF